MRSGSPFGGESREEQISRAVRLGLLAYAAVILTILTARIFNSYGITGLPSMAALFLAVGGMSPLLWMTQWLRSENFIKHSVEPLIIRHRWSWIVSGAVFILIYGVFLGPTINV